MFVQGSLAAVQQRSPIVAGEFAVWTGVFSTIECTLVHLRKKEDPWNDIISGAATGGIVAARNGLPAMAGMALIGGVLMVLAEGVGILVKRIQAELFQPVQPTLEDPSRHSEDFNRVISKQLIIQSLGTVSYTHLDVYKRQPHVVVVT